MDDIALAVVAPVVPDAPEFRSRAFSRAANSYIRNLLEALGKAGLGPDLVLSFVAEPAFPRSRRIVVRGRSVQLETGMPVRLMGFPNVAVLKQLWLGAATLVRVCLWAAGPARGKCRVIYCFNLTVPPGVFLWAAARLTASKVVVSLNDIGVPGQSVPNGVRERVDFWFQRKLIPRFDGHVAVADAIMRDFAPNRSWVRLEGGVTDQQFENPGGAESPNRRRQMFSALLAGGLEEVNGVRVVLAAAALGTGLPIRWVIAGAGPLETLVREAASRCQNVSYLGFLTTDDLAAAYRDADLLLNVRLTRSVNTRYFFPSKLIEYLATGIPVLTTATGHAIEEFGDFVFQLSEETPVALLQAVQHVVGLPCAERCGTANRAREYVRHAKHWNRHGRVLAEYLSRVARGESTMTSEQGQAA
jgi:glycosyltransferase involved in cell wall biosynthesis